MTDLSDQLYRDGTKLALNKQYNEALQVFYEVTQLDPMNDQAWVAKGVVQTHLKNYQAAYQSFSEALKINPNNNRAKDNQDVVSQYIDLEMPTEIPMPPPPGPISPDTKPLRNYSASWFLFLWPFIVIVGWMITVPSMNIFTSIVMIPAGLFMTVFLSALFIGIDAAGIEAGKGQPSEMGSTLTWKPVEWGLLTFFFLIIFYPFYLIKRRAIFESQYGNKSIKTSSSENTVAIVAGALFIFFILVFLIGAFALSTPSVSGNTYKAQAVVSSTPTPTYSSSSPRTVITTAVPTTRSNPRWGDLEVTEYHPETGDYGWGYISGTVKNLGSSKYSAVIISANLYDANDVLLGNSRDMVSDLEPYGSWKFNIPVMLKGAEKYKIIDITAY